MVLTYLSFWQGAVAQAHFHCPEDLPQTFRRADAESDSSATNVHSHQALHHSPNRSLHSHERLPSGVLKDFGVGGERAPSNQAHLSDDISGSNDSLDGCNLSDKHERTMVKLPSVRALADAAGNVPFGSDDEQESSPLVTLPGPEKNLSSASNSPVKTNNDFPEQTSASAVREPWDTPGLMELFILITS